MELDCNGNKVHCNTIIMFMFFTYVREDTNGKNCINNLWNHNIILIVKE